MSCCWTGVSSLIEKRLGGYEHTWQAAEPDAPQNVDPTKFGGKVPHVAVVGCGLAGLSAAHRLALRGVKVTVFEKDAWLGGKVGSWMETLDTGAEAPIDHGFHLVCVSDGDRVRYFGMRGGFVSPLFQAFQTFPCSTWYGVGCRKCVAVLSFSQTHINAERLSLKLTRRCTHQGFHAFFHHYYNLNRWVVELDLRRFQVEIPIYRILTREREVLDFRADVGGAPGLNLLGLAKEGLFKIADLLKPSSMFMAEFFRYNDPRLSSEMTTRVSRTSPEMSGFPGICLWCFEPLRAPFLLKTTRFLKRNSSRVSTFSTSPILMGLRAGTFVETIATSF